MTLTYHPGLPLTNGKLIMWLFLSTEIMFFAGLIGTYIVLRFGAPNWPRPHDVHLSEPIGAFNTFVLICSSVSIVLASGSRPGRTKPALAKLWMLLTLVLGSVFLGVKMYEYNAKFSHGIYPDEAAQPDLRKGRRVLRGGGADPAGAVLSELDALEPKEPEAVGRAQLQQRCD